MDRDALVVGINTYEQLAPLGSPAADAEAIAQLLAAHGEFQIHRLPEVVNPTDRTVMVGRKTKVSLPELEAALVRLFKPTGNHLPDIALFFFSGHGLRKDQGIQEGFLATSEIDPGSGFYGLSLQWLRRLLQESPIRQQIVWLDCCHSGELLNFDEADPGNRGSGRDRCFIAASRDYEPAYEEVAGNHGVLTQALLQALDPSKRADGVVTNFSLTEFTQQALKSATQRPLFANSGSKIILTGRVRESSKAAMPGNCPYKGLLYFDCNDQDPNYFYGRTALTDALLEEMRQGNFLAVLGASGSGKSSVVRAGLVHQLRQGQRLSGSDRWKIYIFQPGQQPLQSLAAAFLPAGLSDIDRATQFHKAQTLIQAGAAGLVELVAASPTDRVVLVIDQFEECFTLCQDEIERQQFFECLLGALDQTDGKLSLVIALRADFFGKCLEREYAGLANRIQAHLVTVAPLNRQELEQAIVEPAKQVGLEVEAELVSQMITDVEGAPGSLPLLQYTLTELWQHRTVNWLTFAAYNQLGGVRGTLQQRAEAVYAALSPPAQTVAKHIFLELTQLGEGTEDTRRRVPQRELITAAHAAELVNQVIQILAKERLIVTTELVGKSSSAERVDVIDIAHEALIRHWSRLRQWIEDNRVALKQKRDIEAAAEAWLGKNKPLELAYLLQGTKLAEAETFLEQRGESLPLSSLAREWIQVSQQECQRLLQQERNRKRWRTGAQIAFPALIAIAMALFGLQQKQSNQTIEAVFLSQDPTSVATALPRLLNKAQQLTIGSDSANQEQGLVYYRKIIQISNQLATVRTNARRNDLISIREQAKQGLVNFIDLHRIPTLADQLHRKQFGQILPGTSFTKDFENQFTPGALRTTYQILMQASGVNADLNQDGILSADEVKQIPCETLLQIESLWRQAKRDCFWDDAYQGNCVPLPVQAPAPKSSVSLSGAIFYYPDGFEDVLKYVHQCKQAKL
jgi:energy-coupling factor transporter ATP-binding protein EcfA2